MCKNSLKLKMTAIALICSATTMYGQQSFSNDNLAILVAAASASNTTASVVEINKTTADQTAVQTIVIPSTGDEAYKTSGSAQTSLYASNSGDGSLLCFSVHKTTETGNVNAVKDKVVLTINNAGTLAVGATYTSSAATALARGATTINNTDFYIADESGQFTNNATASSPSGNFRAAKPFGGVVYMGSRSSSETVIEIGTASALTDGTCTGLPGLTNNNTFQDFYLVSSGENGTLFDVLYVLRTGGIEKYSLVEDTWTSNGIYTGQSGFGLAAEKSGDGANLYLTTGNGATTNNNVIKLTDTAGYNVAIDITTANNVTLYTAPTGAILKGIAFAPKNNITSSFEKTGLGKTWTLAGNTLSFSVFPKTNIEIYSVTGNKLMEYAPANQIETGLSAGIYILKVNNAPSKVIIK